MLKKIISYLVISSILCLDIAWAVKGFGGSSDEEHKVSSPLMFPRKVNKNLNEPLSPVPPPSSSHATHNPLFLASSDDDNDNAPLLKEKNDELTSLLKDPSEEIAPLRESSIQADSILSSDPSNLGNSFVRISSDDESSRDMSLKTLNEWVSQEEFNLDEALKLIQPIENRPFFLKWVQIDHTVDKILYALWLRKKDVAGAHWKRWLNSPPLWIEGQGIPLNTGSSYARAMTGLHQGVDYFTKQSLSPILWGLVGYQIVELKGFYPLKALRILVEGNKKSVRGILSLIVQNPEHAPYFFSLFAAPLLYGVINALFFARKGVKDTPEDFLSTMKAVKDFTDPENRGGIKGFWNDKLRWILPYPEMGGATTYLVYRLLLDGTLAKEEREDALHALIDFAQKTTGWSKLIGLDALQKLAIGTSLKQLGIIEKAYGKEYRNTLLQQRAQALEALRQENPGIRQSGFTGSLHNLYAHYLRWEMGDFDSKTSAIAWGMYKAVTVGLTVNFLVQIATQIANYLNCPKPLERGFNYAMKPTGYSDYTQKCFEAYLSTFNKVPGQPACTLVNLFPKFKLDPTYTLFNLSGAGVTGEQVADLIMGLRRYQPHIYLTQFDLSNNAIKTASDMAALFKAFKNITATAPPDKGITLLNLSKNQFGYFDEAATIILGQGLQYLPQLQTLDLSKNSIGSKGGEGVIAIGKGLQYLPQLQILNLSYNQIERQTDNGTVAIGQGLHYLTQLKSLDLSGNGINYWADNGTIAIGEGLHFLSNLEHLNLSENEIGYGGAEGICAIGEGLKYLTNLKTFNLSRNEIGNRGDNGIISLGQGLKHLPHLQILDLSHSGLSGRDPKEIISIAEALPYLTRLQTLDLAENEIGLRGDNGTVSIAEALPYLTQLQKLDLSYNMIGYKGDSGTIALGGGLSSLTLLKTLDFSQNRISSGFANLTSSITQLKFLENLYVLQSYGINIPSSQRRILQQFWNHRNSQTDVYVLLTTEDVQTYLNSLPSTTQAINLSRSFPYPSADLITPLFKGMSRFQDLQALNLSNNLIGTNDIQDDSTIAIGEGLTYVPQLQALDLSQNQLGLGLKNGVVSLGEGLRHLTQLRTLNLSLNNIGLRGDNGTIAIGNALKHLPQLQILDLSGNAIVTGYGENGVIAISQALPYLSQLRRLDLSGNGIGGTEDEEGTIALGQALQYLSHLQHLDLSYNGIGATGENGAIAIGNALKHLTQLQTLGFSANFIGYTGSNGIVAISEGLTYLTQLRALDLSENPIKGLGAQALFNNLPQAICNGLQVVNLQYDNFTDMPWSQAANALEGLYSAKIHKECAASQCFGTPISLNTSAIQCRAVQNPGNGLLTDLCVTVSSSASSLSPPFIFKAFSHGEFVGPIALLLLIGSNLSPLASKVKGTASSWFEEEMEAKTKTKASSRVKSSSWIYFQQSVLLLTWLSLLSFLMSDGLNT